MKIMLTGGGSGGHFYPIIAVAEEIKKIAREEHLIEPTLYFAAPDPYDKKELFDQNIEYVHVSAGKLRRYFSILNFFDLFRTGWGVIKSLWQVFIIFPDVVFGKGGYGSFPVLFAARLLGIPVIIHESDTAPGRVNKWAGKFAKKIALSFPQAADHFKNTNVALTGNPVRKELFTVAEKGAHEFLHLESETPVIFVMGGSQGAQIINETLIEALPELTEHVQVIHQTGREHFEVVKRTADVLLADNETAYRYHPFPYLNALALRMAAGAADIIVSRAGGSALFEIAQWGVPSIIIPITDSNADHQRQNAFAYARKGAAIVVEEENFTPHLLTSEIQRLLNDEELQQRMTEQAKEFARPEAARKIAREILDIALEHEDE